jgi:hypothetical protein
MAKTSPPNRTIAKSRDLEMLLRKAISVSTDPIITKRARGWFPRLVLDALKAYVEKAGAS